MGKGELDIIMKLASDIESGKYNPDSICIKRKQHVLNRIEEAIDDEDFAYKEYQSLSNLIGMSVEN